ncbi:MAG: DNA gyrase subunit A [Candidatus Omnitrophica bacterium]|nr:DNA gyrase subunit A [Candidatus Omnitrophota bacterium]
MADKKKEETKAVERVIPVGIDDEMKASYLSYAMSVIVGRALPDVRDGLKPVHRRILFAMRELGLEHTKAYKKSARIVGETLGKYHPHGDTAVYDTLVRMVQDFSLRYPLVDGQGNFGSIDGDAPAAMRYTEARMASISELVLADIDKETVDFTPNFDDTLKEPVVLPSVLPNLLVNGSSGIAVGMATNIPPHHLGEVVDGITAAIDNPDISVKELMSFIKGPDFPTGGIIRGKKGIESSYLTGRGHVRVYAKADVEEIKGGREAVILSEIPYQVNKTTLIEQIAKLVQDKKIEGISDLRDESDKEGMRIVVELKRDTNAQIVLNQLYEHTQMQTTFGVIMLALVNNRPHVLNLKQMIEEYIRHRKEVIVRRTTFELNKAQARAHILEGLKKALANLDRVIETIKKSKDPQTAKTALMEKFDFSAEQAQAILDLQLQRLTSLEREKIDQEYVELLKKIELYESILKSEKKVLEIIKQELKEAKEKYGDERRTQIVAKEIDLDIEDLIQEEDVVITVSHAGYIKRLPVDTYRSQRRGGKGVTGAQTREEDFIEHLFTASTHDYILFFTNRGRLYWLKVHEIPQASRTAKGKPIVNVLEVKDETITSMIPVSEFSEETSLVMVTKLGTLKKTPLIAFSNPRKGGLIAITLEKGDELVEAEIGAKKDEVVLATRKGKAIRFAATQVRDMGRSAKGVRGIRLEKHDEVIGMEIAEPKATLLTVTEQGFGKRTRLDQYRTQGRGGKGIINIKTTKKNGEVVSLTTVEDDDEIMVMTQNGMIVRIPTKDIRTVGRSAIGVRIMRLDPKDKVTSVAKVEGEAEETV